MSYAIEVAKSLADTLARFTTLNPHQLAGHVANLDFWLAETRHSIDVLEGYRRRFEAMAAAQGEYVAAKSTAEFTYVCNDFCPICAEGHSPRRPKPVPDRELKEALKGLRDAAYRFLVRCHQAGFIEEDRFRKSADAIGTGVDPSDVLR